MPDCSICSAIARTHLLNNPETSNTLERVPRSKEKLTASIVICTRFRSSELRKCLLKLAAQSQQPDELVIVDNSDGDSETEKLAREFAAVCVIEPKAGLSRARYRGLAVCKSDIIAYLDDDASPDEHWLERICEPFSDTRVAAVIGAAIYPDDVIGYPS